MSWLKLHVSGVRAKLVVALLVVSQQYLYELDSFISKINFNQLNNDIKEIAENFEVQVNSQGPHQYSWNKINRAIDSFTEESINAFYRLRSYELLSQL